MINWRITLIGNVICFPNSKVNISVMETGLWTLALIHSAYYLSYKFRFSRGLKIDVILQRRQTANVWLSRDQFPAVFFALNFQVFNIWRGLFTYLDSRSIFLIYIKVNITYYLYMCLKHYSSFILHNVL